MKISRKRALICMLAPLLTLAIGIAVVKRSQNTAQLVTVANLSGKARRFYRVRSDPTSRYLAAVSKKGVYVLDARSWNIEHHIEGEDYTAAEWSSDGTLLCLTTVRGAIEVMEADSWERFPPTRVTGTPLDCRSIGASTFIVSSKAFSDPAMIGIGGLFVVECDRLAGRTNVKEVFEGPVLAFAVSEKQLAVAIEHKGVVLYRIGEDNELTRERHLTTHPVGFCALSVSPSGNDIVLQRKHSISIFRKAADWAEEVEEDMSAPLHEFLFRIDHMAFLPDSNVLALRANQGLVVMDLGTRTVRRISRHCVSCLDVITKDQLVIIDCDNRVNIVTLRPAGQRNNERRD